MNCQIKVNETVIREYFKKVQEEQKKSFPSLTFPPLPKKLDDNTKVILKAYKNMAKTWNAAGGSVPNPLDFMDLLHIMGRNRISFCRKTTNKNNSSSQYEDNDDREYIDEDDNQVPLEPYIRAKADFIISKLAELRFSKNELT